MPSYNIYLGNVNSGLNDETKNAARSALLSWFSRIVPSGTTALVSWTDSPPTIQDNELLVYFVRSSMDSIVRALPDRRGPMGSGDGFTAWGGSLTASEVYASESRGYLAEMAFHELMHNKLHLDDAALHRLNGLAHVPVTAGTTPSAENITQMRGALNDRHRQWTGGWTAANDPLLGL